MTENQKLKNSMRMEENSTKKNEVRAESRKLAWQCIVTVSEIRHGLPCKIHKSGTFG